MIKAIIFDFDGTISNRQINAYEIFNDYLKPYFTDYTDMEYEAMLQDFLTYDCNGTTNVKFRLKPFMNKYSKDNRFPEDFEQQFTDYYYENMWTTVEPKKGIIEVLEKLYGHFKLAILSNGQSKSQHDKIDHCGVAKYFDDIMVSGDIGINKPDKRIFEIMADRLSVKCNECLFVGDVFSSDILGSMRANMIPVWITTDYERPADYYNGYRIHNMEELFDIIAKENSKKKH